MPGVTFFCFFVQPETNRKGVVTTPLGRTRVKGVRHPVFLFCFLLRNYCNSTLLWPTWIKLNLMTYELTVDRFYAQLGVFFSLFHMIDVWNMDELNLMTFEFNVDRLYAQLGAFSIFTISHIREMKPGSNWIPWPMNLMLTNFTPNWALFYFRPFTW